MKPPSRILIIGDSHAKPSIGNRRFTWLGEFIVDTKPDLVVDIGDFFDMESLSSYDKGKKSFEGRRYQKDIAAGRDARARIMAPLKGHVKKPRFVGLEGNHEERVRRAVEGSPELEGTISYKDFGHKEDGWEFVPFLKPFRAAGFTFQHYFTTGIMGRSVGGETPARSLLMKQLTSCVQGHSHILDYSERTRPDGRKVQGIVAGCYLDPNQWEAYAGPANYLWRKCLIVLDGVREGFAESFKVVGIKEIQKEYGK